MQFSRRTAWELQENEFARAVRLARASGQPLLDLTSSNPTACGFEYDPVSTLAPLSDPRALQYEPDAFGMLPARETVAAYYAAHGADIAPEHICLTTSTSEAYSYLFRLLCDAGDEVLIARPSYPLFDYIGGLDHVRLVEYPLSYSEGWHIDLPALEARITDRTRALILVHPNNPTGNYVGDEERGKLDALCARHGIALIVDEVFLDYPWPGVHPRSFTAVQSETLTFVLSGLSKVCGLPQMKISWLVTRGPDDLLRTAMERLEIIADTFLSVNAPMQFALRSWLDGRDSVQSQITARCSQNLATLDSALRGTEISRLHGEGGWTAVLRVPRGSFVEDALSQGVIVQPGEFYGLTPGRVVLSLLTPEEIWRAGVERLCVMTPTT
ncbi:MAG: pyridoxal phosphate-dependent aminotransferase [Bryocella sp.]